MKDRFGRSLVECWDGWRGIRIGSPVVVMWLGGTSQALSTGGWCRGTTLALCVKSGNVVQIT
jgi:hypothetical protein